jgi:hypothetical protein
MSTKPKSYIDDDGDLDELLEAMDTEEINELYDLTRTTPIRQANSNNNKNNNNYKDDVPDNFYFNQQGDPDYYYESKIEDARFNTQEIPLGSIRSGLYTTPSKKQQSTTTSNNTSPMSIFDTQKTRITILEDQLRIEESANKKLKQEIERLKAELQLEKDKNKYNSSSSSSSLVPLHPKPKKSLASRSLQFSNNNNAINLNVHPASLNNSINNHPISSDFSLLPPLEPDPDTTAVSSFSSSLTDEQRNNNWKTKKKKRILAPPPPPIPDFPQLDYDLSYLIGAPLR